MFQDCRTDGVKALNVDALKSEVRSALINQKVNACPITMRHAWHMSGTFDKNNGTGGSDGATIRFTPESADGANAGLHIIRDLLEPVKRRHPEISYADLYVMASAMAIEFCGGPEIPILLGRSDEATGAKCPENGRLPDATQGAQHLRDVFHRMGLNDQEIVALSGGHTLGSAHRVRSGFDGQWTSRPLKFDNEYFVNLLNKKWVPRQWEGPKQFTDESKTLMMLPTDVALLDDPVFRSHVLRYAENADVFAREFSAAYAKLVALGCPAHCQPGATSQQVERSAQEAANAQFRHFAMHGSVEPARESAKNAQVQSSDPASGRTALHFAAFWGHVDMANYLAGELKLNPNAVDFSNDTPLHDAASHGHKKVAEILVASGSNIGARNREGLTPVQVAQRAGYDDVAAAITAGAHVVTATPGKSKVSTHVLDTANGRPASGMTIQLFRLRDGQPNQLVKSLVTNSDGRTDELVLDATQIEEAQYELLFHVEEYFARPENQLPTSAVPSSGPRFLTVVPVRFGIPDKTQGYHVPLLCSPWSYSTYRGS